MEVIWILVFLIAFSAGVGRWADAWGRNGWVWGAIAFLLSPLLTAIALLIAGKTVEARAEEARKIKELIS